MKLMGLVLARLKYPYIFAFNFLRVAKPKVRGYSNGHIGNMGDRDMTQ